MLAGKKVDTPRVVLIRSACSATIQIGAGLTLVLKGTYPFGPHFFEKYDVKWKN